MEVLGSGFKGLKDRNPVDPERGTLRWFWVREVEEKVSDFRGKKVRGWEGGKLRRNPQFLAQNEYNLDFARVGGFHMLAFIGEAISIYAETLIIRGPIKASDSPEGRKLMR